MTTVLAVCAALIAPCPTIHHAETSHRGGHALVVSRGGEALPETPIETGRRMAEHAGWIGREWACLARLWSRESGWRVEAVNRGGSGAQGIPQALPGSKMASAGADWRTSAETQIRWGLRYVRGRFGTPCAALLHSDQYGWY